MARDTDLSLLISTIYFSKGEIKGRKRLQKTVCILEHAHKIRFDFNFRPYFYGPYSEELADAMNVLEAVGLVVEVEDPLPSGIIQYDYFLTKKGVKIAEDIVSKHVHDKNLLSTLKAAVATISNLDTSDLVVMAKSVIQ
jgi:uncharacterized protein YwgA